LITFFCCILALKYEDKTDKFNALGGYTSAILLGFTSLGIIYESVMRIFHPVGISFGDAILVAVIGLIINLICIAVMGGSHVHMGCRSCEHHHSIEHHCDECKHDASDKNHNHHCVHGADDVVKGENLNFKAAYLHILADVFTSVLAISALLLGKYCGLVFLDPAIGILGGIIIAKWAVGLLKSSSLVLLDFKS
jgi:cation diffusion facilitator family transporter